MKQVFVRGTLGDAFTASLKLLKEKEDIEVLHYTVHRQWYNEISKVYGLFPNIKKVSFVEFLFPETPEVTGIPDEDMVWFPSHDELSLPFIPLETEPNYVVIQAHAGRSAPCPMRREIPIKTIEYMIDELFPVPVILIGTNKEYKKIECACNLIGETGIVEASSIVADSYGFCGPEGYFSFLALSFMIPSVIFYVRKQPVEARLLNNRWTEFIIDLIKLEGGV